MENNSKDFKLTEIGRIPKEWKSVRIADIGDVITGTTPSTKIDKYWGVGYPFVTPSDFTNAKYVKKTERCVTGHGVDNARLIPKDSVMVTCIASIGEVSLSTTECITNQQINTIICNKDVNPHYIYYAMLYGKIRLKRWAGITTSPIIKKSLFQRFHIPIPPLPEQKKIAEVLSTVDQAIDKVDEAIKKTKRVKKGLMEELLTRGIGHREFKNSEIGEIPKKWKLMKIHEIADVKGGKRIPKGHKLVEHKTLHPYIRVLDFKNMSVDKSNIQYLNPETFSLIKKYTISSEDLYISIAGTVGLTGMISRELNGANLTENAAKLCNLRKVGKEFLAYVLNSFIGQNQIFSFVGKAQQPKLALFRIEKIKIPIPPLSEQQKIAATLSTVDNRIELLRKRKEKLEKIKRGLMNDLLTGKKRVKLEA